MKPSIMVLIACIVVCTGGHSGEVAGNFPPSDLAYLEDRIRMYKGDPQLYGTQMIIDHETGETELYQIEDEANVNMRRAGVGLGTLAEYCERFGIEYVPVKVSPGSD